VGGKRANENAAFLSGLLIGAELKDLAGLNHQPVLLGGTPKLRDLYSRALSHLRHENWRAFPDDDCKNAVARGHQIILSQLSLQ
jgi:2-keto-3-deoxy-galactonokinase